MTNTPADNTLKREIAFVAKGDIPAAEPPARTTGVFHWAKENLFSSPLNIVLSVLSIAFIAWVLPPLIQWSFVDAVWSDSKAARDDRFAATVARRDHRERRRVRGEDRAQARE